MAYRYSLYYSCNLSVIPNIYTFFNQGKEKERGEGGTTWLSHQQLPIKGTGLHEEDLGRNHLPGEDPMA